MAREVVTGVLGLENLLARLQNILASLSLVTPIPPFAVKFGLLWPALFFPLVP